MINLRQLEHTLNEITARLPGDARGFQQEVKKNLKPLVESVLERMDLVTREEFDTQVMVLRRTREKLEALEQQVAALEEANQHKAD